MADLVMATLEQGGNDVRIASDGRQALAELATWLPDVVVLDLMLPSMSGHALLQYLRDLPEYRQVPVLVMSGALTTLHRLDGASAVLAKPFDLNELVALIAGLRSMVAGAHAAPGAD